MRSRLLSSAAVAAAALLFGGPAVAQNPGKNLVSLSTKLVEKEVADAGAKPELTDQSDTAKVRPNSDAAGVYFLYVWNNKDDNFGPKVTLAVELVGPKGEPIGEGRAEDVSEGKWKVVKLVKPPAPPPAPATPAPAVEPPPPGTAVSRTPAGFKLTCRVYKVENNKKVLIDRTIVPEQPTYTQTLSVAFLNPSEDTYIKVGEMNYKKEGGTASLALTPVIDGKGVAKLTFVGEPGKPATQPQSGVFTRTLDNALTNAVPQSLSGQLPTTWTEAHLALDGVERVKIYPKPATLVDGAIPSLDNTTYRVRVIPLGVTKVTKPGAFPVRVEVDNGTTNQKLELRINRTGGTGEPGTDPSDEVIPLGGPRDEKLWVDAAEPTKGGIGFATRTTDWVKTLDLTNARGELTIMGVLRAADNKDNKDNKVVASGKATKTDLTVIVDADPPTVDSVVIVGDAKKPESEKLIKGTKLPLEATVTDGTNGSGVQKVTFVLFTRLQDDGTLPPDAIKVDGVQLPELKDGKPVFEKNKDGQEVPKMTNRWQGALTPPKADTYKIAVVAVDGVGNPSTDGKKDPTLKVIQIVDPTPGAPGAPGAGRGFISGVVFYADRPQPGIFVAVGGPDGKAKAVVQTDGRGKFCIDNLPPGSYTVTTFKPSSGKGFIGSADVTVEADKTAMVTIEMVRVK